MSDDDDFGGQTTGVRHTFDVTPLIRPEPPTEAVRRGKERLLAGLSALASSPNDATLPSDSASGSAPRLADPDVGDDERYEFGEAFAAGGLGVVRRGHDRRLGRVIAIKELLRDSPEAARRFALEAAITARLQHPSIVPLYDLGWQGEGKPYYCMKLVDGESLEAKIAATTQLSERLRLLEHAIAVADAIAYAHAQRILHRDIKPANVLVGRFGETVVIDWGLAKDLSNQLATPPQDSAALPLPSTGSDLTERGTVMGTLRYMSPEQAEGGSVDERSDVYSLGALLYHMLAGKAPYGDVREGLVARVLLGELPGLRTLDPAIPEELAAITQRAMARLPADRYASAAAFAEDLRRFATGRMVEAHEYSLGEVFGRWARRHRVSLSASALTIAAVAGVGVFAGMRVYAEQARADAAAREAAAQAERSEQLAFEQAVIAEQERASEVLTLAHTPGRELDALARGVEVLAAHGPSYDAAPDGAVAGLSYALGGLIPIVDVSSEQRDVTDISLSAGADPWLVAHVFDGDERRHELDLWSLDPPRLQATIAPAGLTPSHAQLSHDHRRIAVSDEDRCIVLDAAGGASQHVFEGCADPHFSSDARSLFGKAPRATTDAKDTTRTYEGLVAWELEQGREQWRVATPGENVSLLVHPDGERLIVRLDHHAEERIDVLDGASGALLTSLVRPRETRPRYRGRSRAFSLPQNMALSPDARSLAVQETDETGALVLWDLDTGSARVLDERTSSRSPSSRSPSFSGDGRLLFVGGQNPLTIFDLDTQQPFARLPISARATGTADAGIAIGEQHWIELPFGEARRARPAGRPNDLLAAHEGRVVIAWGDAGTAIWAHDDHLGHSQWTAPAGQTIHHFGADEVLTRDASGLLRLHERHASTEPVASALADADILAHASARPSKALVTDGPEHVALVDLRSGEQTCKVARTSSPKHDLSVLSPRGDVLVLSVAQGRVEVWDVAKCQRRAALELRGESRFTGWPSFADDGSVLIVDEGGHFTIVDPQGDIEQRSDTCDADRWAGYAKISPDGRLVFSSCDNFQMHRGWGRVWDRERDEVIARVDLRGLSTPPAWTSTGEMVFGAGRRELVVVRARDGRVLMRVPTETFQTPLPLRRVAGDRIELSTGERVIDYPITRAGLVVAACDVLARSQLAERVAPHCSSAQQR